MAAPVVISQYWAGDATDPGPAIAELKQRLMALEKLPSHATLISAGEVGILRDPQVAEFHQWLSQYCKVTFISAACTSLHAGILDFYHSNLNNTVVISLELDKTFQQACLNSLGIGNERDQDGLDVVPGVGFIALSRLKDGLEKNEQTRRQVVVEKCQLFSQQSGMAGTQALIGRLAQQLQALPQEILPVSFDICSNWGRSLLMGVNIRLASKRQSVQWLDSIETCQRHYLSLKPLFELQLYKEKLAQHSLMLLTLGGGGRVGLLQLGSNNSEKSAAAIELPQASFEQHSLADDIRGYELALNLLGDNKVAGYQQIRDTLKYPHSRYRGMDNHYFKW
ncbi:hypothetical protein [Thalassomonas actiniarum]|uniref:Uncharacterized protein n=1 Tax=Thalassomonas actiniarum TaxID=485447 RepID=A0AAF0C4H8_9GAMM|nr:hypothetical protein [Thalassomonas actiniarum]WDE02322.1 hypothetical protein SG35_031725 [Thalassomonas actiniarum]